jgi:hypothetical protein
VVGTTGLLIQINPQPDNPPLTGGVVQDMYITLNNFSLSAALGSYQLTFPPTATNNDVSMDVAVEGGRTSPSSSSGTLIIVTFTPPPSPDGGFYGPWIDGTFQFATVYNLKPDGMVQGGSFGCYL